MYMYMYMYMCIYIYIYTRVLYVVYVAQAQLPEKPAMPAEELPSRGFPLPPGPGRRLATGLTRGPASDRSPLSI